MKTASISELKQELHALPPKKVLELCLRLAKFKKENKELLSYLLFDAEDNESYLQTIKIEIDEAFAEMPKGTWYLAKKSLRKILKSIGKYTKHIATKEAEVELLIYFCSSLKKSGIRYRSYKVLSALYDQQIKKLNTLVNQVHEDLRFDYEKQLNELIAENVAATTGAKVVKLGRV